MLSSEEVTDREALSKALTLVYDELRALARRYLSRERSDHTLQPTALVNEACARLLNQRKLTWKNRAHFFGAVAETIRRILVNYAHAHRSAKRGGGRSKLELKEDIGLPDTGSVELLALDEALKRLEQFDSKKARIVELRFFGGLDNSEIATLLNISERTVRHHWLLARAWLHKELA